MLLFHKIGIPAYLGAPTASIIGFSTSILIGCLSLKKDCKLAYRKTFNVFMKMIIPTVVMVIGVFIVGKIMPYDVNSKFSCILYVAVNGIVGALIYLGISFKMGIINEVFGKDMVNKILKKLTFGKISI